MFTVRFIFYCSLLSLFISACSVDPMETALFELKDNASIGIDFENNLEYTPEFNVYKYRNFYNGGGVGLGDVNNDNLLDIYFVSNQGQNKLYLNQGDFTFEDITESAGVAGSKSWSTGVTFVDINHDGLLDIYVCNSGDIKGDNKENELFINQGNLQFKEEAKAYGLNDLGYSTHASFFDYDKDGDLDVYLLNNSYKAIGSFNLRTNERPNRDLLGGDKLMQNQNGTFKDVSEEAGIYSSVIGFGLGVTVSDFNNDTWLDIFISNDFFERDYLYINQQDGTFQEDLVQQMNSISAASMGADAADIDNDGYTDLFVTDMLPVDYERLKTVTTFDDWNRFQYNLANGYHNQFTRNVLQLNNGNNSFNEISRLAGVDASDWSWGALFFDMNNNGSKDLFIANGIFKDLTNQDYLQYVANEQVITSIISEAGVNYKELIDVIPSNKIKNQAFINTKDVKFKPFQNSGLEVPSFSNGSAYGDLDNDGDLDLVVNNVNMPSFVFENKVDTTENRSITLELKGKGKNTFGIGARIEIKLDNELIVVENLPARGFQSCMDHRSIIGIGNARNVDVKVIWSSGAISELKNLETNRVHTVEEIEVAVNPSTPIEKAPMVFTPKASNIPYVKKENTYVDFNHERLLYHMRSNEGAKIGVGDLNGDQIPDYVFPGAKSQLDEIYLSERGGHIKQKLQQAFINNKEAEHIQAIIFDVDSDGDQDILFASGGIEHKQNSQYFYDHLFLNDGNASFELSQQKFPDVEHKICTGSISHGDIDQDGDIDLFIGERIKIGAYGFSGSGFILINDGNGNFENQTALHDEKFSKLGMVTDSKFSDIDGDGDLDLLMVGEFMELTVFENSNHIFKYKNISVDVPIKGWWKSLHLADLDQDGDEDIIVGNLGLNSRFKASEEQPITLYASDFDQNNSNDAILSSRRDDGKDYPYALRHNLIDQIKSLKKKFPDFESFKNADVTEIFTRAEIDKSTVSTIDQLQSLVLINQGGFSFTSTELPIEVQFSPIYAIETFDFDHDDDIDIIVGGNLFSVKPEMGIYDASTGYVLENQGEGIFTLLEHGGGFSVKGEIRDFVVHDSLLIVQISRDSLKMFSF